MRERFDAADIRHYYDRHSAAFVRYGQGGGSIHRAVWGEGTRTRDEAFHYVDDQIAALVRPFVSSSPETHVVDLGCGVGASLCYLARRLPIRGTGITLSPAQAALGRRALRVRGCRIGSSASKEISATCPPRSRAPRSRTRSSRSCMAPIPGVSSSSAVGSSSPAASSSSAMTYADRTAHPLKPPGRIDEFARGWHINTLLDRETLVGLARECRVRARIHHGPDATSGDQSCARPRARRRRRVAPVAAVRLRALRLRHRRQRAADMPRERVDRIRIHRVQV